MVRKLREFIEGSRGSLGVRGVVLVTVAATVVGLALMTTLVWTGGDSASATHRFGTATPTATATATATPTPTPTPKSDVSDLVSIIGGGTGGANLTGGTTEDFVPMFDGAVDTTQVDVQMPMPAAGTVTHLAVILNGTLAAGDYTFTVENEATPGALTCAMATGVEECSDTDKSHCMAFAAGDRISISAIAADTATALPMFWSAKFTIGGTC